ncbi:MAG: ribosomal protein S18-alanine N-acetyltransferase [Chloroflexi bacterium]|nr:ribosomal protein S18-alanine N-acetyltransferase [Chloroflexota bacterium]
MADDNQMRYALRPMREPDIPQVAALEREAFPTTWPPTSFRHELKSSIARYLVAWDTQATEREVNEAIGALTNSQDVASLPLGLGKVGALVRRLFSRPAPPQPAEADLLVGFVGVWFMVDEAHITSIASKESHRGKGIGELLLIGATELAHLHKTRLVTLECRVSNTVAQNLYKKYGFKIVGRRKGYYQDNGEDAFIMSTDPIESPEYQRAFGDLRRQHSERWGVSSRYV